MRERQSAVLGTPECLPRILSWPACTWEGRSCRISPFAMATYILVTLILVLAAMAAVLPSCPQICQLEPLEMPVLLPAAATA